MIIEEMLYDLINLEHTYIGEAPIDVDNCQWIERLGGRPDWHFGRDTYDRLPFMINVRGKNNQETLRRAEELYEKIKSGISADYVFFMTQTPRFFIRDQKYRVVYDFEIEFQMGGY